MVHLSQPTLLLTWPVGQYKGSWKKKKKSILQSNSTNTINHNDQFFARKKPKQKRFGQINIGTLDVVEQSGTKGLPWERQQQRGGGRREEDEKRGGRKC